MLPTRPRARLPRAPSAPPARAPPCPARFRDGGPGAAPVASAPRTSAWRAAWALPRQRGSAAAGSHL